MFSLTYIDLQTAVLITAAALFRLPRIGEKVDTKKGDIDRSCVFLEHWLLEFSRDQSNIY